MKRIRLIIALAASLAAGHATAQGSGLTAQQRGAAFDLADANRDGKLSRDEFANTPRGRAPNDPDANWKASDKNGDGYVTRQEFIEPMTGESQEAPPKTPETLVPSGAPAR